jgi:hypothetical protein
MQRSSRNFCRLSATIALVLLGADCARAQALVTTDLSTTLGTGVALCAPANSGRKTLFIENPLGGSANNVCYSLTSIAPSCGAIGTSVLPPGSSDFWPSGSAPSGAVYCTSSGTTTPVTVRSGQ